MLSGVVHPLNSSAYQLLKYLKFNFHGVLSAAPRVPHDVYTVNRLLFTDFMFTIFHFTLQQSVE